MIEKILDIMIWVLVGNFLIYIILEGFATYREVVSYHKFNVACANLDGSAYIKDGKQVCLKKDPETINILK